MPIVAKDSRTLGHVHFSTLLSFLVEVNVYVDANALHMCCDYTNPKRCYMSFD